jgi:hypothetical protein
VNEADQPATTENPFCSRRVRPGGIPYLFGPQVSAAQLVVQLRQDAWWGQVVGAHGSGKSALLAALRPAIERAGRRTVLIELHDGQRRLPLDLKHTPAPDHPTVLIVDGYEQLGFWERLRLKRFCCRSGLGLLLSAHAPVGLPELCHTSVTLELAQQIVEQLQREHPLYITAEDVAQQFADLGGDLREMLFRLYDLYEQRRRGAEGPRRLPPKP